MAQHQQIEIKGQAPYIPMIKITPSQAVGYYQYCGPRRKAWQTFTFGVTEVERRQQDEKKSQKQYTGELTDSARKKLKSACEILFALARTKKVKSIKTGREFSFKIACITLTLSSKQGRHTDREIKKELLEPFLRHFRTRGLYNYIWKAERQFNGNVHFHILTDCYLEKGMIRDYWNRLQEKLGFISEFHSKYGHRSPNSTDVKAVHADKGMVNYMLKYMLKPAQKKAQLELGREVDPKNVGKIWDSSLNLKLKNETAEPVEDWQFELLEKSLENEKLKAVECENCVVYLPVRGKIWNACPNFLKVRLQEFLRKVREKGRENIPERKKHK